MQKKREPVKLSNTPVLTNDLLGTATGLAPWATCTSPSRLVMLASQIQQKLITSGMNRPRFFTGQEKEYAKYTFGCKTDFPCKVIAAVDKFETGRGGGSFRYNPKKTLIVKNLDTGEYDVIEYTTYCSHHTAFGFEFIPVKENQRKMQKDEIIQRNTRLNRSPGVTEEGDYIWATRTKAALITHHAATEDGFLVSREWCEENKTTGYGEIIIMVPKRKYMINTYGNDTRYQPFPLPGEKIQKNGLVSALREYDDILGAVEMSNERMMDYDYYFDEKYFIEAGVENARVVDIDIWCSDGDKVDQLPLFTQEEFGESDAITRLWEAKLRYLNGIKKAFLTIEKEEGKGKAKLTKALHRLVTDSMLILSDQEGKRKYRVKQNSIPTTYIKLSYMYDITPTIGFKITNMYGFKGVICAVKPRAEMPRYDNGKVADFVGDGFSAINRMNPSIFFEQYTNYQAEVIEDKIRELLSRTKGSDEAYRESFDLLCRYYKAVVPLYLERIEQQGWNLARIRRHVDGVAKETIHAWMPSNTPGLGIIQIQRLVEEFPPEYGTVSWVSDEGETVTSTVPVVIGDMYLMILEKTGHDWGAVDVAKRQVHGVPTKPSGKDRFNLPYRKTPYRFFGEAEVRNYAGIIGGEWVSDMLDRANNPKAQEHIWAQVISAERPTDLARSIDRKRIPLCEGMHIKYMNNALYCSGAAFEFLDTDFLKPQEELQIKTLMKRHIDPALLNELSDDDEQLVHVMQGDSEDGEDDDNNDDEDA